MVAQISYHCDNCGRTKADHLGPLDLGDGKRMIDLCAKCTRDYHIDFLTELLAEYGATVPERAVKTTKAGALPASNGTARSRSGGHTVHTCPVCHRALSSRTYTIKHMVDVHNMTAPAASRALPVASGRSVICEVCDMVLDERGRGQHMFRAHPDQFVPLH